MKLNKVDNKNYYKKRVKCKYQLNFMYFNWNTRRVKYNLHVRNHGYPDLEVEIKTVD